MIKFLEYRRWIRLFNKYRFSNWETSDKNSIMFTVEDDVYVVLDVNYGEVYVEQFNTINDLEQFYETKVNYVPGLQSTIFDY
ncbi:hypothetical protein KFV08_07850 [Macrococcoides canis]|uniref:hypothetical protein n=1 Tax=Macrococcoides canis TaxID=1855823 RepID=UPI00207D4404|nr:hypothetical protein [Macrococcus canis]MCO4095730.1 hypothetical protein [Macrococcus canis]UTH08439.1 hypothetical protein KFV08_07850 [Macrococcus canis]